MKKILFVCRANVGRSQMAQALYNSMTRTEDATSAGVEVGVMEGELLHKDVIQVMDEVGLNVAARVRKQLRPSDLERYEKVVVMLDGESPAYLHGRSNVDFWPVADPGGQPLEVHRATRDTITQLIRKRLLD